MASDTLVCEKCGISYPIQDGIPMLLSPLLKMALNEGNAKVKYYYLEEERYDWTRDPKALELAYHRYRRWSTWRPISKILKNNDIVLDLGCGTGLITSKFSEQHHAVIAVDLNRWALSRMNGKPWVAKIQGDGELLPLQDETVNLIVATEMIEHLEAPELAAAELFRICKPGGHVVGTVPSNSQIWKWRQYLSLTCGGGEPFHRNFDREDIADIWRKAGFKVKVRSSCLGLNWLWVLEK
jgi:SAM-dependent methyltransferase